MCHARLVMEKVYFNLGYKFFSLFVCISLLAHTIWYFKTRVKIQSVHKKSIIVSPSTLSRNVQLHLSLHPPSSLT